MDATTPSPIDETLTNNPALRRRSAAVFGAAGDTRA